MKKIISCVFFPAITLLLISGCTGSKNRLSDDDYFKYGFDRKPAIGMVILKVTVFDRDSRKISGHSITGVSGMPSMHGAHDSPETALVQNKNGDYLLPVNVVMPGEWQIRLKFTSPKGTVSESAIKFNVR